MAAGANPYARPVSGGPYAVPPASGVPYPGRQPASGVPYPGGQPASGVPYPGQPMSGMPYPGPRPGPASGFSPHPGMPVQPIDQRPAKRRGSFGRLVATGLFALLLAGGGGLIGGLVVHESEKDNASGSTRTAAQPLDRSSLASIANAVKPSVVDLQSKTAEGSGVVLSADGYILTNNHVVADAGGSMQVTFSDGRSAAAKVIGTDAKTDLAVLKADGVSGLTAAKFGDSDALQVGDTVLAIGSPLGLTGTVTEGIVSALNRTIDESTSQGNAQPDAQSTQGGAKIAGAVQTDAAINPGNSGGALVNMSGEVIGINTAIATSGSSDGNVGVGFAIPSNRAKQVAQALMTGQKVSHPYIGVSVGTANGNAGAQVASVATGSPAAKAGLQANDVITKAGSKNVYTADDLLNVVQASKVGDKLQLSVSRGGSTTSVAVTVGEQA
jgi:putative serine protease PepD